MNACWPEARLLGLADDHLVELDGHRLEPATADAFKALRSDAAQAGFELAIASGFRDFERQLSIFNGKWQGQRPVHDDRGLALDVAAMDVDHRLAAILRFSALPGASRHHWGTDLDLYCRRSQGQQPLALSPREYGPNGPQGQLAAWLVDNAGRHGFFLPYGQDRGGVAVEPWHLSYAPVSEPLLAQLTPKLLEKALTDSELAGKEQILPRLSELHRRYVANIAEPS
ncbi:M15 family metallopeptidase [Gallaecimonas sp. GXIMD4217]|uniref:M15 family metallopeptidase n=1 Tax=Gallaecimonas sp. GXIMD4217 TaxID=3131927 RepID=UPI00311ACE14